MTSHFLLLIVLFSFFVSLVFGVLLRDDPRQQIRTGRHDVRRLHRHRIRARLVDVSVSAVTPPRVELRSPCWLWGPVLLQLALIFVASSIPNLRETPGGISDKSGHAIGYGMLAGLFLRALAGGRLRASRGARHRSDCCSATLYGVSDEFHQLVRARAKSADPHDCPRRRRRRD